MAKNKTKQLISKKSIEFEIEKLDFNADNQVDYEEITKMGMHKRVKEDLAVGIAWIGHTLNPDYKPHKDIIKQKVNFQMMTLDGNESEEESSSKMYPWFELTYYGEPICLNEYLCEAANYP